jgi:hypothetical protein
LHGSIGQKPYGIGIPDVQLIPPERLFYYFLNTLPKKHTLFLPSGAEAPSAVHTAVLNDL